MHFFCGKRLKMLRMSVATMETRVFKSIEIAFRRWRFLLLVFLLTPLVACSDSETEQRQAFIEFLQTRVINHGPVSVPQLTKAETKQLGPYAKQYAIITDFHDALNERVQKPMVSIMARGSTSSVHDIVQRSDELAKVREGLRGVHAAIDEEIARSDTARAALKQADDLKPVYDTAYEKTITIPAQTFKTIFPAIDESFGVTLRLADYIKQHGDTIHISGSMIQVSDPAVQAEVNEMLQDLNARARQMNDAQAKLQKAIYGG